MRGLILFVLSIVGFCLFSAIGFVVAFVESVLGFFDKFFVPIAISVDQLANAWMGSLFNLVLKKSDGYKFGNIDQTISYVIGRNHLDGTLTKFGTVVYKFLNWIEKDHCEKAVRLEEGI